MIGPMDDARHLRHAARLALRGHGGAEPNPLVGCVIVSPDEQIVGWGYHRTCGEAHAEIHALRRAGNRARGATVYVTLEPCNHTGRTGPCAEALIHAGVGRVVIGRLDPHHAAGGGAQRLRDAGIDVCVFRSDFAASVSEPFVHRLNTGLPWVTVKWAQTLDGKLATRSGQSQWISSSASRRMVHRERGRVDAILTGIGTVQIDDPLLTARQVRRRRIAKRVIADPQLQISLTARLINTAAEAPTIIACREDALHGRSSHVQQLRDAGAEVMPLPVIANERSVEHLLRNIVQQHDVTHVLVEAGPGLITRLFRHRLVNEAWVFIAPLLLGDESAPAAVRGMNVEQLADGTRLQLIDQRRRGGDTMLRYRVRAAE